MSVKPYTFNTTPGISKRMSHVKAKNGSAEILLAKFLWHDGIRYRKNFKALPGSPDIAITKYKIAVFIDGEFWHGFDWENRKHQLHSNKEYWISKIEENMERDRRNDKLLISLGWTVFHFWGKEVLKSPADCANEIKMFIGAKYRK